VRRKVFRSCGCVLVRLFVVLAVAGQIYAPSYGRFARSSRRMVQWAWPGKSGHLFNNVWRMYVVNDHVSTNLRWLKLVFPSEDVIAMVNLSVCGCSVTFYQSCGCQAVAQYTPHFPL